MRTDIYIYIYHDKGRFHVENLPRKFPVQLLVVVVIVVCQYFLGRYVLGFCCLGSFVLYYIFHPSIVYFPSCWNFLIFFWLQHLCIQLKQNRIEQQNNPPLDYLQTPILYRQKGKREREREKILPRKPRGKCTTVRVLVINY